MFENELFGWIWILLGFVSGSILGLFFRRSSWLGGYDSLRRRLIRLGHISFFGLGLLNLLFVHSALRLKLTDFELEAAAWCFIIGGVSMPLSCGLVAWREKLHLVFIVPVASLIIAAWTVVVGLWRAALLTAASA